MNRLTASFVFLMFLAAGSRASAQATHEPFPLAGTWTLVSADVIRPDGSRGPDYGASPSGLLMFDPDGRYSVQIYKSERPRFASGDKLKGTAAEYEAAVVGASTHFGTSTIDTATHTLTMTLQSSSYPNQEKTVQKRIYELDGDVLSYRVPPRPDGSTPVSVWRRLE